MGDPPPPDDDAQVQADLREIFAQAQRDLDAGRHSDVTILDLQRAFERDALAFKAERDAWQAERERRAREQDRRARAQKRRAREERRTRAK